MKLNIDSPATVQGTAHICVAGFEQVFALHHDDVAKEVTKTLYDSHFVQRPITIRGKTYFPNSVRLEGYMISTDMPLNHTHETQPHLSVPAFAGEGRLGGGVPCEFGLFDATPKKRKWLVTFGPRSVQMWRALLNLPIFYRTGEGSVFFAARSNLGDIKNKVWQINGRQYAAQTMMNNQPK